MPEAVAKNTKLAAILTALLMATVLFGCQASSTASAQLGSLSVNSAGVVEQSAADDVTKAAQKEGNVKIVNVYDYAPFTGKLDADAGAAYTDRVVQRGSAPVAAAPSLLASPAFYPFTATLVETYYPQSAYEGSAAELESIATSQAFKQLAGGTDKIIIASMPNEQQMQLIKDSGRDIAFIPFAREAIVVYARDDEGVIGGQKPVLTSDELRALYDGGESGNPKGLAINALAHGNGSTTCFEEFLTGSAKSLDINADAHVFPDMNSIIASAASETPSVGYAYSQFYRYSCNSPKMNLAAIDGIEPTFENICNGTYPLLFDAVVMFDRNSKTAPQAQQLVEWLLSEDGQATVVRVGMCPLRS